MNSCIQCAHKVCKRSLDGTLDICDFGIAYYNKNGKILKKEEKVTLRHVSQNLRHELNKILHFIVQESTKIDPTLSTRRIDIDNPASRIIGATVIIDHFIQMISGINDFHPSTKYSGNLYKESKLMPLLDKYTKIYSLIENTRRSENLQIEIKCDDRLKIKFGGKIIEYIISVLVDNMWKYSLSSTSPAIIVERKNEELINIIFENTSCKLEKCEEIFSKGYQQNIKSEGFGYGLYWANLLIFHYNELYGFDAQDPLELTHQQHKVDEKHYKQLFIVNNIRV